MRSNSRRWRLRSSGTVLATVLGGARVAGAEDARIRRISVTLIVPDLSVLSDEETHRARTPWRRAAPGLAGGGQPGVKAKAASDEVKRLKAEAALLATHEDVEPLRDLAIGGFKEGVAKRIDDLTERSHRDREELEGQVGALALLLEGIGSALEASGASLDAKASEARQFVHRAEKEVAGKVEAVQFCAAARRDVRRRQDEV